MLDDYNDNQISHDVSSTLKIQFKGQYFQGSIRLDNPAGKKR